MTTQEASRERFEAYWSGLMDSPDCTPAEVQRAKLQRWHGWEAARAVYEAPPLQSEPQSQDHLAVQPCMPLDCAEPPTKGEMTASAIECHGLDTPERVCFYEQDFYVLSNFSAFTLMWKGYLYDTSEAAYQSEKFAEQDLRFRIMHAASAHEAFKLAEGWRDRRRKDWDDVKVGIMRDILRAKARQHEYVRRKLLATGDRELVENSWRDDFWGWGPNRDGKNMLGKLWMEVRAELRQAEGHGNG